jgi:hypothetical protein
MSIEASEANEAPKVDGLTPEEVAENNEAIDIEVSEAAARLLERKITADAADLALIREVASAYANWRFSPVAEKHKMIEAADVLGTAMSVFLQLCLRGLEPDRANWIKEVIVSRMFRDSSDVIIADVTKARNEAGNMLEKLIADIGERMAQRKEAMEEVRRDAARATESPEESGKIDAVVAAMTNYASTHGVEAKIEKVEIGDLVGISVEMPTADVAKASDFIRQMTEVAQQLPDAVEVVDQVAGAAMGVNADATAPDEATRDAVPLTASNDQLNAMSGAVAAQTAPKE